MFLLLLSFAIVLRVYYMCKKFNIMVWTIQAKT